MGFHAGAEAARVLAKSIDYTRQGQIAIRDGRATSEEIRQVTSQTKISQVPGAVRAKP